ncbi:replication endonuclease [Idiomarina loihiensis]|uniref:replication endonuclease n=1 Tax=Idiomarina loihiensis TaxID=135577 RepID=UPI00384EF83F
MQTFGDSYEFTELSLLNKVLKPQQEFEEEKAHYFFQHLQDFTHRKEINLLADGGFKATAKRLAFEFEKLSPSEAVIQFEAYGFAELDYTAKELQTRLSNEEFWLSVLRRERKQVIAEVERAMGLVSARTQKYCGDITYSDYKVSEQQAIEYLERHYLQSPDGKKVSLKEISDHNVSNPYVRFCEWISRVKGFDIVAQEQGHHSMMVSMTVPGYMHATLKKTGRINGKYSGATVKECMEHFNTKWSRIRAKLKRAEIDFYGMRVVEPHHDGTPHWHLLLNCEKRHAKYIKKVFKHYALQESANEKGAEQHRVQFEDIDRKRGSAASYLAKYLAKGMTGFKEEGEGCRHAGDLAADCTRAWASAHRIRQFQQFGGPSVSVYRELRRLKASSNNPILESARIAADAADWAEYWRVMGGFKTSRKDHLIKPIYEQSEIIDKSTGEVIPPNDSRNCNKYGEPKQPSMKGIRIGHQALITRSEGWEVVSSPPQSNGFPRQGEPIRTGGLGLV